MEKLEKIDVIRERTGLGYADAAALLDEAGGDLIEALIRYEQRKQAEEPETPADRLTRFLKDVVAKGNATNIRIRRGDRVFLEIPVTAGVVGALIAPQLAVVAAAVSLFTSCVIEIERADGTTEVHELSKI